MARPLAEPPHFPLPNFGAPQFTPGDWEVLGSSMYHGVQSAPQLEEVGVLHCAVRAAAEPEPFPSTSLETGPPCHIASQPSLQLWNNIRQV